MREIEREGLELLGIYHSHPQSPAIPSRTDIERAFFPGTREENYPGSVYLIVGMASDEPEIRGYLIRADGVEEITVRIEM